MSISDRQSRSRRFTAVALFAVVAGMTGLAFASVPLYRLFCQATGYGGTPRIAQGTDAPAGEAGENRQVTVAFDANVNPALPWRFKPEQRQLRVTLGKDTLAVFRAENRSDAPLTGTATFNITPDKAAQYFVKVQCFCFTEQHLAPHAAADLPVSFYVDPAIADDPDTKDVSTITLSYTFYRAEANKAPPAKTADRAAPNRADNG